MSSATRTSFYRELSSALFSPARYATFAAFFALSAAFFSAALQLGEGKFWTLEMLWLISAALPLPILVSLVTMPLFAGERAAGTYESLALLPIPLRKIVIGKFTASFLSVCVGLAGVIIPWLLLRHTLGDRAPENSLLYMPMALLFLHAFSWTALGTLCSALARRPWVAATGTLFSGGVLMLLWAAFSRFCLGGNIQSSPFPIWSELLDAAGGRIVLHSMVFHLMFGLWCLFACIQALEARRGTSSRLADGAYLAAALSLATALLAMTTLIAAWFDSEKPIQGKSRDLSERTLSVLPHLSGDVTCTILLPRNDPIFPRLEQKLGHIRAKLQELSGTQPSAATLSIETVDPHSDLARAADTARRYGAGGKCVIFDNGSRFELVPYDTLVDVEPGSAASPRTRLRPAITRFKGEQACATALAKLARPGMPVVYALSGHGERDFKSYDQLTGYSDFARELSRDGYALRDLALGEAGVPEDCDLLVVAGPRFAPGAAAESAIVEYTERGGRIMLLADRSPSFPIGWEGILARLGMVFGNVTAIAADTLGGYSMISDKFGGHPVVRDLGRSAVYFVSPQVIDPAPGANGAALSVNVVVSAPDRAWGEANPEQLPRHFDKDIDRSGTLPLILASESPGGSELGIRPFRAFVVGDSNFAANSLLEGGTTANRDLLLNAVAWLTEREWSTESSESDDGGMLRLNIPRRRQIGFWLTSVLAWPGATLLVGVAMAAVRRMTR